MVKNLMFSDFWKKKKKILFKVALQQQLTERHLTPNQTPLGQFSTTEASSEYQWGNISIADEKSCSYMSFYWAASDSTR